MITRQNLEALRIAKRVAREKYAWPGGYPLFVVTSDGGCLCPACVKAEFYSIARAAFDNANDGWRAVAHDINWEDPMLFCDGCSARIESAYAEDNAEDESESDNAAEKESN